MTERDLVSEARALLAKATPGPWAQSALCNGYVIGPPRTDYPTILTFAEYTERGELHLEFPNTEHNMALVTRAPALLSAMADEIERLHKHIADLNHDLDCAVKECNERHG